MRSTFGRLPIKLAILGAMLVLWAVFLRPTWLGGQATYILVRGDSMLPTHTNGDFLFIQSQADYEPGDVVAYRVPHGELGEGKLVVHRILEATSDGFVLRGDNNPAADPWRPSSADVAGRVLFALPMVGQIVAIGLSPAIAASLATAVMVMLALARRGEPRAGGGQAVDGAKVAPGERLPPRPLTNLRSTSR